MDQATVNRVIPDRPFAVKAAASAAMLLAVLSVVGALVFNLIGADRPALYVNGGLLVLWGIGYTTGAVGLLRRMKWGRILLLALLPLHAALNVVKVAGGEIFSVIFLLLIAVVAVGLLSRSSAGWLDRAE